MEFLDAGLRPVCIGFGSMTGSDPQGMTRLLVNAVTASGQRAVLLSGWAVNLGALISAEDGVAAAVDLIGQHLSGAA